MSPVDSRSTSIRPEWLYELAALIQRNALSLAVIQAAGPGDVDLLGDLSEPETPLEGCVLAGLLSRLQASGRTVGASRRGDGVEAHVASGVEPDQPPHAGTAQAAAVAAAADMLREDCSKHWTVAGLARRVGFNRTDLEIGFRGFCGEGIHAYLITQRMHLAAQLLRDTEWRIEEVAKSVGWHSKVSMYEHFSRRLHLTPDEYRRRWKLTPANDAVHGMLRANQCATNSRGPAL